MVKPILRLCYLCGKPIEDTTSDDHVVPKQFIKRKQPKVKGYEYAGVLPTHFQCNNKFGGKAAKSEVICQKALKLLQVILDENSYLLKERVAKPNDRIMAINSEYLTAFTKEDLEFFDFIDVREISDYSKWTSHEFLSQFKPSQTFQKSINIALSVLAKSAAAVLVSRCGFWPNRAWEIIAIPYSLKDPNVDLDELFGKVRPFEIGVKLWTKKWNEDDWLAAYKAEEFLVVFNFLNSRDSLMHSQIKRQFNGGSILGFKSKKLMDLIGHDWTANQLKL